ncbi:HD domain-containing protein [Lachnospiraceae bacterium ZAX-1]
MKFIKVNDLQPGMRLARPIYNKLGVMLYDRDTKLTSQGILSIDNFGLIGLYILEPAEPAIPLTEEEIEFEKFQTTAVFKLKDDLVLLKNNKAPKNLISLSQTLLTRYGKLDHKIHFTQNVRSADDYVYKHCLSTAILVAMMVPKLKFGYEDQLATVCAALIHNIGMLFIPPRIIEKGDNISEAEKLQIKKILEKGYALLHPESNDYDLPDATLQIAGQMARIEHSPDVPMDKTIRWHKGSTVLHVAAMYDTLTAMGLDHEPVSKLVALDFLRAHQVHYLPKIVNVLTQCIHVLPTGCCVDLSDGEQGIVIVDDSVNFATPVIIRFSDHKVYDLNDPLVAKNLHIKDIMQTMDVRVPVDEETLKQFVPDEHTQKMTNSFMEKRAKLIAAGRL